MRVCLGTVWVCHPAFAEGWLAARHIWQSVKHSQFLGSRPSAVAAKEVSPAAYVSEPPQANMSAKANGFGCFSR